ncbi:MAG: hypothetical protein GY847_42060 [Proteobacteria bacterium]|nr:hypothetical protein [Pseudomonadota bacterium]
MSRNQDDEVPVKNSLYFLKKIGCPDVQLGQGTDLLPQHPDGDWPLTPDLVAGHFYEPDDERNFYIDVFAPSGHYMTKPKAQAPATAEFLQCKVKECGEFVFAEVSDDHCEPLTNSIVKKSKKYAEGRNGSPLLGLVAYFCDGAKYAGALFASLNYFHALNTRFGGVPVNDLNRRLLGSKENKLVRVCVSWPLPIAFVLYLRRLENNKAAMALFQNKTDSLNRLGNNRVMKWLSGDISGFQTK